MSSTFQWALIGPGSIANRFAEAVSQLDGCRLHAICGRDAHRSEQFAQRWSVAGDAPVQAHTDLARLLADPAVEGVYIATPHGQHYDYALAALRAGKAVLCEKSLVPTQAQAQRLVAAAREHQVFLMEAVWTRFLPVYQEMATWLREGRIGQVHALQSSFCFPAPYDPDSRLFNPALAGGALLDVGVYNLNATRFVLLHALGEVPPLQRLEVSGVLAPTGVDARVSASLDFGDGLVAQFVCGLDTSAPNTLQVMGEAGAIVLPETFWQATRAQLLLPREPGQTVERPFRINGFENQIVEAMQRARAGDIESPVMPHAETLAVLGWIDQIRAKIGVRYPFDDH
ncbi:Predicted dehydrogenase [Roseateles sp. YR242]|uniref:Gfo/Idh/MocA family protein n=1 Tax=Roseateles sp. YR242 TaxID=1855305 RepID=UPI0008ADF3E1|nr:Gfo/Idh/MocA family oxidoreductase [Roseateles sp. YR242]SEK86989.1 Predicted dehydrogenase [Roseateles sp. YR242]